MVFETEPAKLMSAWTGHVWTTGDSFDWYFAFGAFVSKKDEINEAQHGLECKTLGCG
jgi:hypothetical protein